MTTLTIEVKKSELVACIENNVSSFGDDFSAIYVDVNGYIDCRTTSEDNSNWMPILTFGGMGEFNEISEDEAGDLVVDNSKFEWSGFSGDRAIAEYIVDDGECLTFTDDYTDDNGDCSQYKINIVEA